MKLNITKKPKIVYTHEGAKTRDITAEQRLLRLTCSCLLWEDTYYINGKTLADQIADVAANVSEDLLVQQAISLKENHNLRHVPLYIAVLLMEKHRSKKVNKLLRRIIVRPDEIAETLKIYWRTGKRPIAKQLKRALRGALRKFGMYQVSKWNREGDVELRDTMFLSHPKPFKPEQEKIFKGLADRTLKMPDTWEKRLSSGQSKKQAFSELMAEGKLGFQACLMNLRNMIEDGIPMNDVGQYLVEKSKSAKSIPHQFLSAYQACPEMLPYIEKAYFNAFKPEFELRGNTCVLVDVSASMYYNTSSKSKMSLALVGASLAMFARECCENAQFFSFSEDCVHVPAYRGVGLIKAIDESQSHWQTLLNNAIHVISVTNPRFDRMIIITDEQVADGYSPPNADKCYIINIGSYQNGVGYHQAIHINGFSPHTFRFIHEMEKIDEK